MVNRTNVALYFIIFCAYFMHTIYDYQSTASTVSRFGDIALNETIHTSDIRTLSLAEIKANSPVVKEHAPPPFSSLNTSGPKLVHVSLYIRSLTSINTESMDYVADLHLQQHWNNQNDADFVTGNRSNQTHHTNDRKTIAQIWKPDVVFINSKQADFQYVTVPNVFLRVEPNRDILYVLRLKVKFDCIMDFYKYPMDKQVCSIEMSTFASPIEELRLLWHPQNPVTIYEGLKLAQFRLSSIRTAHCNISYYFGQYSCLKVEFNLEREMSYHLVRSYLSTALIVAISWISFWLPINAVAARVTLGVTTLLTISSKGVSIENKLPPVAYLRAIDVWIFGCTTFVFCALIEFAVTNYVYRLEATSRKAREDENSKMMHNLSSINKSPPSWAWLVLKNNGGQQRYETTKSVWPFSQLPSSVAENIDQQCRVFFPFIFATFTFCYWIYYCYY